MITADQIPVEQSIFTDAWRMLKSFYRATSSSDWDQLHKVVGAIDRKYQNASKADRDLMRGLVLLVADHIEQISHEDQVTVA